MEFQIIIKRQPNPHLFKAIIFTEEILTEACRIHRISLISYLQNSKIRQLLQVAVAEGIPVFPVHRNEWSRSDLVYPEIISLNLSQNKWHGVVRSTDRLTHLPPLGFFQFTNCHKSCGGIKVFCASLLHCQFFICLFFSKSHKTK